MEEASDEPRATEASLRRKIAGWLPLAVTIPTMVVVAMRWCLRPVNSDALLGPIMSVQNLTVYYWGQDRLVNLVPALAFPFRDVTVNFYVQSALTDLAFVGLITFMVLLHLRGCRTTPRIAAAAPAVLLSGFVIMWGLGPATSNVYVFEQPYPLGFLLLFVGCLLSYRSTSRAELVLGGALIVLAELFNPSVLLFLPVMAVLALAQHRRRRAMVLGAWFGTGAVLSFVTSRVFGMNRGAAAGYVSFNMTRMMHNLPIVLRHLAHSVRLPLVIGLSVLAVLVLVLEWRSLALWLRQLYGLMVLFAVGWVVLFSGSTWVESNALHFRYFFPVHLLFMSLVVGATAMVIDRLLASLTRVVGAVMVVGAGALVLVACFVWAIRGVPSIGELDYIHAVAEQVKAGEQADVHFVVGPYVSTWPAVFSMETHHRRVFGIVFRGETVVNDVRAEIAALVGSGEQVRVLCLEPDAATCAAEFSAFVGSAWQVESTLPLAPSVVVLTPNDV